MRTAEETATFLCLTKFVEQTNTRHEFHMTSSVQVDIFMPVDCCDSDIFFNWCWQFIHYLMLKTWVNKTERMSVKFKDSLSKATA